MLKPIQQAIITHLWHAYCQYTPQMMQIVNALQQQNITALSLDHFAVIDLPGPFSGIPLLKKIFSALGYGVKGNDYLPDKQNDFTWMAGVDSHHLPACEALPQVVVADFRLEEMPTTVRAIIEKYAAQTHPALANDIVQLAETVAANDHSVLPALFTRLSRYFAGRDWPLPTYEEFHTVHRFNELLAWVLIFGRRPNHFTLSVHLLDHFANLAEFHHFVKDQAKLELNTEGGEIKGGKKSGVEQGSTLGALQRITLANGDIDIRTGFVEFVWRFPLNDQSPAIYWNDFHTGFIAKHANHVIESLYE